MAQWPSLNTPLVLGAQKYNQNNLATLPMFSGLSYLSGFFGHDLGFKLVFGFAPGSGLYFWVWAGFGPEPVGPFTTLNPAYEQVKLLLLLSSCQA